MNDLKTVKEIVKEVMFKDPKTRESDTWLILQVLRNQGFKIYIDYNEIKNMPSFESITRSRRYWQNTEKVLLSSEKTIKRRCELEDQYKTTFKY